MASPAGLTDQPRGASKGSKLTEVTKRTIVMLKEAHPEWGCQRISDELVRGPALSASPAAVARVLHEAGYQLEERVTRPHPDKVRSFERAKPNQLWQTDLFTFVLKRQNRRLHLVGFMDDHSRFIVGFGLGNVIGQERSPRLSGRFIDTNHVLGHSPVRNVVAQQEQFRQDPWCAPGRILMGHAANQFPDLAIDARPSRFAGARLPPPIKFETLAMPADDGFGLHDHQRGAPVRPQPRKSHPKDAIARMQFRAFDRLFTDRQLLPQGQVLDSQVHLGNEHRPEKHQHRFQHAHGRALVHRGNW